MGGGVFLGGLLELGPVVGVDIIKLNDAPLINRLEAIIPVEEEECLHVTKIVPITLIECL